MVFKYQPQIDELLGMGNLMPLVYDIVPSVYYRYAFSDRPEKNHIPQYISSPKRMLSDIGHQKASVTLLALSCFADERCAIDKYIKLKSSFKNIQLLIGDSLFFGTLAPSDGMVTIQNENTHFNLFESETCDLTHSFTFKQIL